MTDQSLRMSHWGKFINSFVMFYLHDHTTFTLWLLHYNWPFETQDGCNVLALAACPQYHDIHPCMHSSSWINNVTIPCLVHLSLAAACCPALVGAAQLWLLQRSDTSCTIFSNFQHAGQGFSPMQWDKQKLPTPVFCSEQGGSPPDAEDGARPGARMQIRIAIQQPARIPRSRSEHLSKWIFNRISNWICVDILLDRLG